MGRINPIVCDLVENTDIFEMISWRVKKSKLFLINSTILLIVNTSNYFLAIVSSTIKEQYILEFKSNIKVLVLDNFTFLIF